MFCLAHRPQPDDADDGVMAMTDDDDWQSFDPRAWTDYEDVLNDMQEERIREIEWVDEDPQFDGVPEDFHLHIIEICLICGNPMESCVCEMPKLQKSSNGCDLTATEGERMDYLRDIQGSP